MSDDRTAALKSLEASVLGALLIDDKMLAELPNLEPDDFLDPRHRVVFAAMRNLEAKSAPLDVVMVEAEIARAGYQGVDFSLLGQLALHVPTATNALEYARQIRDASLTRKIRRTLADVIARGDREQLNGGEYLSTVMRALSSLDEDQPDTAVTVTALVKKRLGQLEQIAQERARGERTMLGFPTGVQSLDDHIGGVQPGIVTIVAARPGMGKSSFGLSIADGCSAAGFGVHLFSLEDTEDAYADRTLSRTSLVPAEAMRDSSLTPPQIQDIARAMGTLRGRRWLIDGRSGVTADEIVRSVRRHKKANHTCVVIVDYVQLVKRAPRMSPHEALTEIVTTLADAAKQDRVAYVVMSQLNRGVESRQDKRPVLSDLRESGSLEERAKCVIGLYRGSVYGEPIEGIDWDPNWNGRARVPTKAEHAAQIQLQVLKNSNGRTGHVWATWSGPTTRIS